MKKIISLTPVLVLSLGLMISSAIVAFAQVSVTATPAGVTVGAAPAGVIFPIAELGNCKNQGDCKSYCNKKENIQACVGYAEKNGMMSAQDAAQAREFADALAGEAPGGCQDKKTCEKYCADISHLDECVAFAEKHNFVDKGDLAVAKNIAKALKSGKKLPGGCSSQASCNNYCENTEHAEECISFAEGTGILSDADLAEAKKVLPLIKAGKAPGGCKTKTECKAYCEADGHFEECISFAEEAGFVDKEEAVMARKTGGKGPGGCKSKAACEDYCNKSENAATCFNFAKEKGLLSEKEVKEIEDGMGRLRSGLSQMPPEMVDCLKEGLGADSVSKIEAGTLIPGPKVGEMVKACVSKSLPKLKEKMNSAMKMATPEVKACLEQGGINEAELEKIQNGEAPSPSLGDVMKKCFNVLKKEGLDKARAGLAKMPPQMRQCVEDKLGADVLRKIANGEDVEAGAEMGEAFESCVQNAAGAAGEQFKNAQIPAGAKKCIEDKLGMDVQSAVNAGKISGPEEVQKLIMECMKGAIPGGAPSGAGGPPDGTRMGPPAGTDMGPPPGMGMGGPVPAPGGPGAGGPPAGGGGPDCSQFASAPSCDYVPAGQPQEMCKKCRGQ